MNEPGLQPVPCAPHPEMHSELLLLPDGLVLVHNLTRPMARALHELNPDDPTITPRAATQPESQTTTSPIVA